MKSVQTAQPPGLVMADTCIWIAAERQPEVTARLTELITRDRLVMCGVVYAEILRGLQETGVRNRRARQLLALQWLATPPEAWQQTADLARSQDRTGRPVPLTDAHVAALCIEHEVTLWTTDRHFDQFSALKRIALD
jgi:predicted nucleic acid-binding protein